MELATYLKDHKWIFNIECDFKDFRLCDKRIENIKSFKEFPPNKDFNEILLYILFMYQKDSPLVKKYTSDLKKRREEAVKESGLEGGMAECLTLMTVEPGEDSENPLKKTFDKVVKMILEFLMYQGDLDWANICVFESLFLEYSTILLTGISNVKNDKDLVAATNAKKITMEEYMKVSEALKETKNRFYNGDSDLQNVAEKKMRFTPEAIAGMKN